jgi:hypothetical protein
MLKEPLSETKRLTLVINLDAMQYSIHKCLDLEYKQISNFVLENLNNKTEDNMVITGNSFVIDMLDNNYYHFIDSMGQFLLLKKHISNLKLVIIEKDITNSGTTIKKFVTSFIDILDKNDITFVKNIENKHLVFQNVYFVCAERISFMSDLLDHGLYDEDKKNILLKMYEMSPYGKDLTYAIKYVKEINNFIKSKNSKKKLNRKIFISTKSVSEDVRIQKYNLDVFDGLITDIDPDIKEKIISEYKVHEDERKHRMLHPTYLSYSRKTVNERYISEEDESSIHQYFINKGYDFIDPTKMTIQEQIDLYQSCSHIATFTGSSCLASAFCSEETNFFIINNNLRYDFYHDSYVKSLLKNTFCIFEGRVIDIVYSAEDIISELENKYGDLI